MKTFLSMLLDVLLPIIMKMVDEDMLRAAFNEHLKTWAEKHLTVEELSAEGKDFIKLIKEKF